MWLESAPSVANVRAKLKYNGCAGLGLKRALDRGSFLLDAILTYPKFVHDRTCVAQTMVLSRH